jgi:hypothetical protein
VAPTPLPLAVALATAVVSLLGVLLAAAAAAVVVVVVVEVDLTLTQPPRVVSQCPSLLLLRQRSTHRCEQRHRLTSVETRQRWHLSL